MGKMRGEDKGVNVGKEFGSGFQLFFVFTCGYICLLIYHCGPLCYFILGDP